MADEPKLQNHDEATLHVIPLGNGRYRVSHGTRSRLAWAVASTDACWVFLDGQVYVIDNAKRETRLKGGRRTRADDETALSAPMPATVLLINVTAGEAVAQGDVLIMLEAMKMELPVKAPRAGRVKAIGCQEGELVQPGAPLLELE